MSDYEQTIDHNPPSGPAAIEALLQSIPQGPAWNDGHPANTWEATRAAVEQADQETKDAALSRLLALHRFSLSERSPTVAERNVHVGDVLELFGVPHRVTDVTARGDRGQTIYIKARPEHLPDANPQTFANDVHTRTPLLHRTDVTVANAIFSEMVDAVSSRKEGRADRLAGLMYAYVLTTGANEDETYEAVQQAVQARHDETIASAGN